jgi:hypothetical protein
MRTSSPTGGVYGELTSLPIPVTGGVPATVSFWYGREVEHFAGGSFDKTYVEVRLDGGTWQPFWSLDSRAPSSRGWQQEIGTCDIPRGISTLQLRFVFDSVDGNYNDYRGWFIDDVSVRQAGPSKVAAVAFSPAPSAYSGPVNVTLACATPGATIRYTTDGAEPTDTSLVYAAPIPLTADVLPEPTTTTIRARAYKTAWIQSDIATGIYTIQPKDFFSDDMESEQTWTATGLWHVTTKRSHSATHSWWFADEATETYGPGSAPSSLSPAAERTTAVPKAADAECGELTSSLIAVRGGTDITLSFWYWRKVENCAQGSYDKTYVQVLHEGGTWRTVWSLDSRTPSSGVWQQVTLGLGVATGVSTIQIRFVFDSVDRYYNDYAGWLIDDVMVSQKVAPVTFSPAPSSYSGAVGVALACATPGATTHYTTDGAEPTEASLVYTTPIILTAGLSLIPIAITVKARAYKAGLIQSDVAAGAYAIQPKGSFSDDVESGQKWTATGLWHMTEKPGRSHSPTHSWWFADDDAEAYGLGTVSRTAERAADTSKAAGRVYGELTSPSIPVTAGTTEIRLSFWYWLEVEHLPQGSYDRAYVQVKYGDGEWQTFWSRDSGEASGKGWQPVTRNLSVPQGVSTLPITLRMRFVFDSVDGYNNNYAGWLIDDVEVILGGVDTTPQAEETARLVSMCIPNPVTSLNTAQFVVNDVEADRIRVEVYDLGGTLVWEEEEPGNEITWHAVDQDGSPLANGVYLYRTLIQVAGKWVLVGVEKVVILR